MNNQDGVEKTEVENAKFRLRQDAIRMYVRVGIVAAFLAVFIYIIVRYTHPDKEGYIKPTVLYSFLTGVLITKLIDFYILPPERGPDVIKNLNDFQRRKEAIRMWTRIGISIGFFGIFIYVILAHVGPPDVTNTHNHNRPLADFYIAPNVVYSFLTGVMVAKFIDFFLQPLKK